MDEQTQQQLIAALNAIALQLRQIANNTSNLQTYLSNIASAAGRQ